MKHHPNQKSMEELVYIFLDPGTTRNGQWYLELLEDTLNIHMHIHGSRMFMHDGAT